MRAIITDLVKALERCEAMSSEGAGPPDWDQIREILKRSRHLLNYSDNRLNWDVKQTTPYPACYLPALCGASGRCEADPCCFN